MRIAMIPARMGSQRLPQKNLRTLQGIPLIVHAIRKCKASGLFDEIWVNSEDAEFASFAEEESVNFHERPAELGDNHATSEDYVAEFLKGHNCEVLYQVHTIAPLLRVNDIRAFVAEMDRSGSDTLLTVENIQLECLLDGSPLNFEFSKKTNSQEILPVQRVCWAITAWKRKSYLEAFDSGNCATYSGKVGVFALGKLASHVIKDEEDLNFAEYLIKQTGP